MYRLQVHRGVLTIQVAHICLWHSGCALPSRLLARDEMCNNWIAVHATKGKYIQSSMLCCCLKIVWLSVYELDLMHDMTLFSVLCMCMVKAIRNHSPLLLSTTAKLSRSALKMTYC